MEELKDVLTIGKDFLSGPWLLGLVFLWMLRHDILHPLKTQIEAMPEHVKLIHLAFESRNQATRKVELALKEIASALRAADKRRE